MGQMVIKVYKKVGLYRPLPEQLCSFLRVYHYFRNSQPLGCTLAQFRLFYDFIPSLLLILLKLLHQIQLRICNYTIQIVYFLN